MGFAIEKKIVRELASTRSFTSVNIEYLFALSDIEEDSSKLVSDLIYIYLETAPTLITKLQMAVATKDNSALAQSSHKLKMGSERIGARNLAELCQAAALSDSWFEQLCEEYTRVEYELLTIANFLLADALV